MVFTSPSKGQMSFDKMFRDIMAHVTEDPAASYRLIVGTDSHCRDSLSFVTAVILHRVGKGARYYYRRHRHRPIANLRQRIYYETAMSLNLGGQLAERLASFHPRLDIEIHLDVGQNGESRDLIREVVGMVTGSGFGARIKPESYGASKVADKHTK